MNADDPRIRICLYWCGLPPGSCDEHPDCPFSTPRRTPLRQSVVLERCERLIAELESAYSGREKLIS